ERLQHGDIPAGRQVLRDHHCNLQRVAEYCESNYLQASDKRKALEETMAMSTQSLASVTYQVSSLANAFLRLLDLQAAQLRKVEADIDCVAQRVNMHKEKVSRREIGLLTVSKKFPSYHKITSPPNPPSLEPYYRKPLNFSILDDIGHGIKVSPGQGGCPTDMRGGLDGCSCSCSAHRRSTRVPEPIQPPVVPENKLSAAKSGEGLEQAAQRGGGCPVPGGVQGQVGWGPGQPCVAPGLEVGGPAYPPQISLLVLSAEPLPTTLALRALRWPGWDGERCCGLLPSLWWWAVPWGGLAGLHDPSLLPPAVVALYPYEQQKDNELSFQPGAILFVTRRYSDGWYEGVMGQEAGFFPSNYVEPF
ncbi:ABI3 protein, partial [Zapornia atra]|nr:ABI3 protein [Zapornia atra]